MTTSMSEKRILLFMELLTQLCEIYGCPRRRPLKRRWYLAHGPSL